MWRNTWSNVEQFVEIFSWATIGLGDRRAARSDPPPPPVNVNNRIKIMKCYIFTSFFISLGSSNNDYV